MLKNLSIILFISTILAGCGPLTINIDRLSYPKEDYEQGKENLETSYKEYMVNQSIDWDRCIKEGACSLELVKEAVYIYFALDECQKSIEAALAFKRWGGSKTLFLWNDDFSFYRYARNCFLKTGQYDLAIEYGMKLISLEPALASSYNEVGVAYYSKGQYKEAIPFFKRALELEPKNAVINSNLADCYYELKQYDEALSFYNKALSIDPEYLHPYFQIAEIYYEKGNYENIIAVLKKVETIDPDSPYTHYAVGNWFTILGKFDDAIASLDKAVELFSYSGIGLKIMIKGSVPVVVSFVSDTSPAKEAGIEIGDRIIAINGESTKG